MIERRKPRRQIDRDLAVLTWQNGTGYLKQLGTVQQKTQSTLDVVVGKPLPVTTTLSIFYGDNQFTGIVRHLEQRGTGYSLGVELQDDVPSSTLHA
jgi:hypothetical protein